jgi:hypothetical protein
MCFARFSAEELLGTAVVELVKKEDSTLGIVISGKQKACLLLFTDKLPVVSFVLSRSRTRRMDCNQPNA